MDLSSAAPALPSAQLAVPTRVPAHGQLLLTLFWPGSHSPSPAGSTDHGVLWSLFPSQPNEWKGRVNLARNPWKRHSGGVWGGVKAGTVVGNSTLSFLAQTGRNWEQPFHSGKMGYLPPHVHFQSQSSGEFRSAPKGCRVPSDPRSCSYKPTARGTKCKTHMGQERIRDLSVQTGSCSCSWAINTTLCFQPQAGLNQHVEVPRHNPSLELQAFPQPRRFLNRTDMNLHDVITPGFLNKGMLFHIFHTHPCPPEISLLLSSLIRFRNV